MNFLDAAKNVFGDKQLLDHGTVGGMAWGVKRYLSVHPPLLKRIATIDKYYGVLGPDRYYDLMVLALPRGNWWIKGLAKPVEAKIELKEELREKVCRHFGICLRELPVFLQIWNNQGKSMADLLAMFGWNSAANKKLKKKKARAAPKAKAKAKAKRKKKAKKKRG